jgi:hypothetical protein
MIRLFNTKTKNDIFIDDNLDWIIVEPHLNEENIFIKIEMVGFFLINHSLKCIDCSSFVNSIPFSMKDWFLTYNKKTYTIKSSDINNAGYGKSKLKQVISEFENGTKLTIQLEEYSRDSFNELMLISAEMEDYDSACYYRDVIETLENN